MKKTQLKMWCVSHLLIFFFINIFAISAEASSNLGIFGGVAGSFGAGNIDSDSNIGLELGLSIQRQVKDVYTLNLTRTDISGVWEDESLEVLEYSVFLLRGYAFNVLKSSFTMHAGLGLALLETEFKDNEFTAGSPAIKLALTKPFDVHYNFKVDALLSFQGAVSLREGFFTDRFAVGFRISRHI